MAAEIWDKTTGEKHLNGLPAARSAAHRPGPPRMRMRAAFVVLAVAAILRQAQDEGLSSTPALMLSPPEASKARQQPPSWRKAGLLFSRQQNNGVPV